MSGSRLGQQLVNCVNGFVLLNTKAHEAWVTVTLRNYSAIIKTL